LLIFKYPDLIPLNDKEKNLTKYASTNPNTDPINNDLILKNPNEVKKSLIFAKKVIIATANITPGIAYPDIENKLKYFKTLLPEILFP
jgi:hypothetical protein